jgi:hypothetical protein
VSLGLKPPPQVSRLKFRAGDPDARVGQFDQLLEPVPPRRVLWMITLDGAIALAIGIALLIGILTAVFS